MPDEINSSQDEADGEKSAKAGGGWGLLLARFCMAALLFEAISGLAITVSSFHPAAEWSVLLHTAIGIVTLLPIAFYCAKHWAHYRDHAVSHISILGYLGLLALAVCSVSGVVLTWQGFFGLKTGVVMRKTHLISTIVVLASVAPHILFAFLKACRTEAFSFATKYLWQTLLAGTIGSLAIFGIAKLDVGPKYVNKFPADYNYLYGTNRPFAPSLAKTDTGGAFDARSLAGSASCGTAGCHDQIYEEWQPSAHR